MMQGPFLLTPVTKKCSKIGLEKLVFLKIDFSDFMLIYLPQDMVGKGIYFVDIALIEVS